MRKYIFFSLFWFIIFLTVTLTAKMLPSFVSKTKEDATLRRYLREWENEPIPDIRQGFRYDGSVQDLESYEGKQHSSPEPQAKSNKLKMLRG